MYDFTFWVLYKANEKDGRANGRVNGAIVIAVLFSIHFELLAAIIKLVLIRGDWFIGMPKEPKFVDYAFLIGLQVLAFVYYNDKRIDRILNKFEDDPQPLSDWNILRFAS